MEIEVSVNDQPFVIEEGATLDKLLLKINRPPADGVAVAVNGQVIPRDSYQSLKLNKNDSIIILTATQGG
ncbi:MAG: sulfur carrier protein ThiS [Candidatus Dadabacteria bacterium]|nr:MAG: sulfur carrier protein ThiS [Candidatus Dadabacteria bacterium]